MTTKRFTIKHYESQDWAYDNNKLIHTKEMVDLLNELHEENQSLKFQLDECQNHKLYSRRELLKENEQLRKDVARYRGNFREMEDVKCELAEENERLKSDLAHTKVLYHSLQDTYSGLLRLVHGFNGDVE